MRTPSAKPGQLPRPKEFSAVMAAPFGAVGIVSAGELIHDIEFLPHAYPLAAPTDRISAMALNQLECYFADPDFRFNLPLARRGSEYRRRIWAAIAEIPRGRTRTYGELAHAAHSIARAVGQACGDNPFPLVIPCHRVVSAAGLGGFAHSSGGFLIDTKRWLLHHEGAI